MPRKTIDRLVIVNFLLTHKCQLQVDLQRLHNGFFLGTGTFMPGYDAYLRTATSIHHVDLTMEWLEEGQKGKVYKPVLLDWVDQRIAAIERSQKQFKKMTWATALLKLRIECWQDFQGILQVELK